MAVKSYGFAIGNLRAKENTLLKQSDLLQLLSAEDINSFGSLLKDKGIGGNSVNDEPLQLIKKHTEQLWQYLEDIAPDMSAFLPFIYENDFHNLKAVLKAVLRERDFGPLVIVPASVDVGLMERAIKDKKFDILPTILSDCAKQGYEILTQTGDAQLADGIIDAACMEAQLETAKQSKIDISLQIIKIILFYNNIKVALRSAKSGKRKEFLEKTLTETDVLPKKELISATLIGEEKVLELLSKVSTYRGEEAVNEYKNGAWRLELFADNLVMQKAKSCRSITMGIEPLIGYMCARKTELKNLKIIYSGIKNGQQREKTEERLRELYG